MAAPTRDASARVRGMVEAQVHLREHRSRHGAAVLWAIALVAEGALGSSSDARANHLRSRVIGPVASVAALRWWQQPVAPCAARGRPRVAVDARRSDFGVAAMIDSDRYPARGIDD